MKNYQVVLYSILFIYLFFVIGFYSAIKLFPTPYIAPEIIFNHPTSTPVANIGTASWYDYDLNRDDQKCRSNDCYSMFNATCASRDFERGTMLTVTNLSNGKTIECRVNDFGPEESTGREIDLSSYTFKQLADLNIGLIDVSVSYK